jgi:uncharacterized membrane protein YkoI
MGPLRVLTTCATALMGLAWVNELGATRQVETAQVAAARLPGKIALVTGAVSLDQAVRMVEEKFRARVVRTETRQEGGRTFYLLRLLSDTGHVWTVRVDAASGSIR